MKRILKALMLLYVKLSRYGRRKTPGKNLLLIRLDAIGDYVLFRNFIEVLKQSERFRDYKITLVGNVVWKELAVALDGAAIERFVWVDKKRFADDLAYFYDTLLSVSESAYDVIINPMYSREVNEDWLVFSAAAKQKIGSAGDCSKQTARQKRLGDRFYTRLIPTDTGTLFEFERNRHFFEALLQIQLSIAAPYIHPPRRAPILLPRNFVVLFIGASDPKRRWDIEKFTELATYLNRQCGFSIVLCGGPGDLDEAAAFKERFGGVYTDLVGRTSLTDLLYVFSAAQGLVSNETSAPHLAVALKTPNIIVVSNGNHYGRFTPYPQAVSPAYHAVFPPSVSDKAGDFEASARSFARGSVLDINDVTVGMVRKVASETLCRDIAVGGSA